MPPRAFELVESQPMGASALQALQTLTRSYPRTLGAHPHECLPNPTWLGAVRPMISSDSGIPLTPGWMYACMNMYMHSLATWGWCPQHLRLSIPERDDGDRSKAQETWSAANNRQVGRKKETVRHNMFITPRVSNRDPGRSGLSITAPGRRIWLVESDDRLLLHVDTPNHMHTYKDPSTWSLGTTSLGS